MDRDRDAGAAGAAGLDGARPIASARPVRHPRADGSRRPSAEGSNFARAALAGIAGQFEPLVKALNDPARKLEWSEDIQQLRQAIARGPDAAAAVHQALEKQYGDDAKQLFRMLWGYTDEDLQTGADRQLVQLLGHETLAVRELAIWNLKEITGLSFYYFAEQTAARRKQSIARWNKWCAEGKIRSKAPADVSHPAAEAAGGGKVN